MRKRILIVNCFFDELRLSIRRSNKIPQAMAPAYLAGAFSKELCDIRLYSELTAGHLKNEALLGWPDMLVLTGLTNAFDRMRHLTAYVRTKNPKAIVVAGGPAIRALPRLSSRYFDYTCDGDVEQMEAVIKDAFGAAYAADQIMPRFDLSYWAGGKVGYVETSRNCNFHCAFCSLTGEGRKYEKYDLETIREHILAVGKKKILVFLDNNFYGNDRHFFHARLELIRSLWKQGVFEGWAALVSSDFFLESKNLVLAKESGCQVLFSGLETFDMKWLRKFKKIQNTLIPPLQIIRSCADAGIIFFYGMMLDPVQRSLSDLRQELEFVMATPEIPLPAYLSVPVPIPNTPFFFECVKKRALLPLTKLRDLDSTTLSLKPLEPIEKVAAFIKEIQSPRGFRWRALQHTADFLCRRNFRLNRLQIQVELGSAAVFCAPTYGTTLNCSLLQKRPKRTFISTSEILDKAYSPVFPVASGYESYFKPTMLTDAGGCLTDDMQELMDGKIQNGFGIEAERSVAVA
ncbi:MAG: radical SAM protein [Desulfobacterales bacterium]